MDACRRAHRARAPIRLRDAPALVRLPLCTLVCVQSGLGGHVHTVGADRQHAKPRAILTTPESATIVRAMCLIALALDAHPRYSLVLAANRDEYHARPTAPASYWDDSTQIFGGRRSEGHTSELQSLLRLSYAVFF